MNINAQIALVTGGASGLDKAVARELARLGAFQVFHVGFKTYPSSGDIT